MKKLSIILISFLIGHSAFATKTVRLDDSNDPDFFLGSNELTSESSGDGTVVSSPYKVYIPVLPSTSNSPDRADYHLFGNNIPTVTDTSLPIYVDLTTGISSETDLDLFLAIRNSSDTDFRVIKKYNYSLDSDTDFSSTQISFDMLDLCQETDIFDCTSLADGSSDSSGEQIFYFFLRTNGEVTEGDTVDLSEDANKSGVFFKALFSNKVYERADLPISLDKITKGDATLKLTYSASSTISNFKEVAVFSGVTTGEVAFANSGSTKISDDGEFPATAEASIDIGNLDNDTTYTLAVAFVDKFLFATALSDAKSEQPTKIDVFLEKNQCYLLSAGFQEDHFVIDYFKMIRDNYLLHTVPGKLFVEFYYSTAPQYTRAIYSSPIISQVVRFFGYLAYYIFRFWSLLALPIIFILSRKIMLAKRQ